MKYLGISPNAKMIKIGENVKEAKWYYIPDDLKDVLKTLKKDDEVSITSGKVGGSLNLTFLAKGKVDAPKVEEKKKEEPKKRLEDKRTDSNFRSPDEITRAEIGKMTSQTLIAMQGLVNPNNVAELIEKVYKKYDSLVS